MTTQYKLERVLVVVNPELVAPDAPHQSPLITRAIELARATGCELEFFHAFHEPSLEHGLFVSDNDVVEEKRRITDQQASLLAEMVARLRSENVKIKYDVRWDHPRTDAILRKIEQAKPDLVMKQSHEHSYVIGITRNTDWDLIRQSSAHIWFVSDDTQPIETIMAAVELSFDEDNPVTHADYDVFGLASKLGEYFSATTHPVHAYQVPVGLSAYASYAPDMGGVASPYVAAPEQFMRARKEIAQTHGDRIRAFASYFDISTDDVRLREGHPDEVLPELAEDLTANLVIMGARNLSRWERIVSAVTAEPVLADINCDLLIVKDADVAEYTAPAAEAPVLKGATNIDLEKAITHPEQEFESPQQLADCHDISRDLRIRILQVWERDIEAQMAAESEGATVRETQANIYDEIRTFKTQLMAKKLRPSEVIIQPPLI